MCGDRVRYVCYSSLSGSGSEIPQTQNIEDGVGDGKGIPVLSRCDP